MSSAEAPSAAVRTMMPAALRVEPLDDLLQARALGVVEPARDAEPLALRHEHEEAAGQRDLGREPRALRLHRVLDRLHHDLLAAGDQVGDLLAVPLALELRHDDLVDVEEAVLLEADLDERRLHPGQDVVDGAEVDVAGDRAALGALEVDLGDAVVLEDRDALLADVDGDQQLALRLRQRGALLRRRGGARPAGWRGAPGAGSDVRSGRRALALRRLVGLRLGLLARVGRGAGGRAALARPASCARDRRACRAVASSLDLCPPRIAAAVGVLSLLRAVRCQSRRPLRLPAPLASCVSVGTRVTNASPRVGARKDTAADAAGRALRVVVKNVGIA